MIYSNIEKFTIELSKVSCRICMDMQIIFQIDSSVKIEDSIIKLVEAVERINTCIWTINEKRKCLHIVNLNDSMNLLLSVYESYSEIESLKKDLCYFKRTIDIFENVISEISKEDFITGLDS